MAKKQRPEVPEWMIERLRSVLDALPELREESAWVGVRWRLGQITVAHVFGGEDQLFRITLRGEPDEVAAFQYLGDPYFRSGWGDNMIGMVLDEGTDWTEVGELLLDSYCIQAPARLVELVDRPPL